MQSFQLRNETLVEIATFLVRRWSDKENIIVEFSDKVETRTRLNENKVILAPLEKRIGNDFQKDGNGNLIIGNGGFPINVNQQVIANPNPDFILF